MTYLLLEQVRRKDLPLKGAAFPERLAMNYCQQDQSPRSQSDNSSQILSFIHDGYSTNSMAR
jgi:hypothetical protein